MHRRVEIIRGICTDIPTESAVGCFVRNLHILVSPFVEAAGRQATLIKSYLLAIQSPRMAHPVILRGHRIIRRFCFVGIVYLTPGTVTHPALQ